MKPQIPFLALLVFATVLNVVPHAAATATWTVETVNGTTGGISNAQFADTTTGKMGVAWQTTSSHLVGFSLRSAAGVWTGQNTDISGNNTLLNLVRVFYQSGTSWVIVAYDNAGSGTARLSAYLSTNDGTSWTLAWHSPACLQTGSNAFTDADKNAGEIHVIYSASAGACYPNVAFATLQYVSLSSIGSPTYWGCVSCTSAPPTRTIAPLVLDDGFADAAHNYGTTTVSGTTNFKYFAAGPGNLAMTIQSGTTFSHYIASGGDSIWSNPYQSEGSTSLRLWFSKVAAVGCSDTNGPAFAGGVYLYTACDNVNQLIWQTNFSPGAGAPISNNLCGTGYPNAFPTRHLPFDYATSGASQVWLTAYTCSGAALGFDIAGKFATGNFAIVQSDATTNAIALAAGNDGTRAFIAYTDASLGNALKVTWANIAAIAPVVAAGATATHVFSGTEGTAYALDVDRYNKIVLARFLTSTPAANTHTVESFDPNAVPTLTQRGPTFVTGCDSQVRNGIFAYYDDVPTSPTSGKQYTAILGCTGGASCGAIKCATALSIRGGDLNNADMSGTVCAGNDFCCTDSSSAPPCAIDMSTSSSCASPGTDRQLPGGAQEVDSMQAIPINFGTFQSGHNTAIVGMVYDDFGNGNVGVWTNLFLSNSPDESCNYTTPFTSGGLVNQICSWRNSHNGSDYMAAASANSATTIWKITGDPLGTQRPLLSLATVGSFGAPYATAVGISCHGNAVAQMDGNGLVSIMRGIGSPFGTNYLGFNNFYVGQVPSGQSLYIQHPVTLSADENLTAFYNGTSITIACAGIYHALRGACFNGTKAIVGNVATPTGTFIDMRLSDTGNVLWVLTSTQLARFDLAILPGFAAQLPNPGLPEGQRCTSASACVAVDNTGISNVPGVNPATVGATGIVPDIPGLTSGGATIVFTLLLVIALAGLAYYVTRNNPSGMVIGGAAMLGYVGSIILFGAPIWPIVVLAILATAFLFLRMKASGGAA